MLLRLQWLLFAGAVAAIASYFAVVGEGVDDARKWWLAGLYLWPPLTIGILAFFQRLLRGGPTKRITSALIRGMRLDIVSLPYRLRQAVRQVAGAPGDVDPIAPSPPYVARLLANVVSFLPTLAAMAAPLVWIVWLTGDRPDWPSSWGDLFSLRGLGAFATFMAYVIACAAFEIVRTWRRVVSLLVAR